MNHEVAAADRPSRPFPGLRPFRSEEACIFFGRGPQIRAMVERLEENRFLAVVGASGAGKSSLVKAGLIPAVKEGYIIGEEPTWNVIESRPAGDPFRQLASSICTIRPDENLSASAFLDEALRCGPDGVADALIEAGADAGLPVLLLIDQFEEVFRYGSREDASNDPALFVNRLLAATRSQKLPIYVILTMRSDFVGQCDRFRGLPEAISESQFLTPRLRRAQIREAITEPIRLFSGRIDEVVVNEILNDIGDEPDQLPLMQHALMRAWRFAERDNGSLIGGEIWKSVGGLAGALSNHAELAWKILTPRQQLHTEILFRLLSEQLPNQPVTRRISSFEEWRDVSGAKEQQAAGLLDFLNGDDRNFLVVSEDGQIDISHEALFRQWSRIKEWVEREVEDARLLDRLADASKQWRELIDAENWRGASKVVWAWSQSQDLERYIRWLWPPDVPQLPGRFQTLTYFYRGKLRNPIRERWSNRYNDGSWEFGWGLRLLQLSAKRSVGKLLATMSITTLTLAFIGVLFVFLYSSNANLGAKLEDKEQEVVDQQVEFRAKSEIQLAIAADALGKPGEAANRLLRAYDLGRNHPEIRQSASSLFVNLNLPLATIRHEGAISNAHFSSSGERFVTASEDGTAQIWDARNGQPIGEPLFHEDGVRSARFSKDERHVVTASWDRTARIWDVQSGRPIGGPLRHESIVWSASFSADGKRIVTATVEGLARIWDVKSQELVFDALRHGNRVTSAEFSANGLRVLTASLDSTARIWDAQNGQPIGEVIRHDSGVNCAEFSRNGARILTASSDGTARVWDAQSGQPVGEVMRHDGIVWSARFSTDGQRVVTAGRDGNVRVWSAESGHPTGVILRHQSSVWLAEFSLDGHWVLTASTDGTARIWDSRSGQPVGKAMRHEDAVVSAQFSGDGRRVVTACSDGIARIWDALSEPPVEKTLRHEGIVVSAQYSRDERLVVTASWDGTARIWDAQSGKAVGELLRHDGRVGSAQFSRDSSLIVTASADKTSKIWDAQSGLPIGEALRHDDVVHTAQFSPDNQFVLTASSDGTARIWDVTSRRTIGDVMVHEDAVLSARFSGNSRRVVTASMDGTARIWNVQDGRHGVITLRHDSLVSSAQFSPDAHWVVTASNGTARIWDARSGEQHGESMRHGSGLFSALFSEDGAKVLTASWDGTARIWNAENCQPIGEPLRHSQDSWVLGAKFNSGGQRVLTAGTDGTARIWDPQSGQPIGGVLLHEDVVRSARFSESGKWVVTASNDGAARIWKTPAPAWDSSLWLHKSVEWRSNHLFDQQTQLIRLLTFEEYLERRNWLLENQNGEPCDQPTWNQIERWIEEKRPGWERMKAMIHP